MPTFTNYKMDDFGRHYEKTGYYWESKIFGVKQYYTPPSIGAPTGP